MKLRYSLLYWVFLIPFTVFVSCSKDSGEKVELYKVGHVDKLRAQSGENQVTLSWLNPDDSDLAYITVAYYINDVEEIIKLESVGESSTRVDISLADKKQVYKFTVIAYNSSGERSEEQTVKGKALLEEEVLDVNVYDVILETVKVYDSPDGVKITWENEAKTKADIRILYKNASSVSVEKIYDAASMIKESIINDLELGKEVEFTVEVINDNQGSSFTRTFKATPKANIVKINKSKWTITASSEEPGAVNAAKNLIDGDPKTYWKSLGTSYPHYVIIDLKEVVNVTAISLERKWADEQNTSWDNTMAVSMDGVNWDKEYKYHNDATARPQPNPLLRIEFNRTKEGEQMYPLLEAIKGRYVRITFTRATPKFAIFGEASVYGYY